MILVSTDQLAFAFFPRKCVESSGVSAKGITGVTNSIPAAEGTLCQTGNIEKGVSSKDSLALTCRLN